MHGLLAIYKPKGMISKDVSRALQRTVFKGSKVRLGHVGSLDPLAEGVLPVACGKATRLQDYLLTSKKTYEVRMAMGFQTDTMDVTGTITEQTIGALQITLNDVARACASLQGEQTQVPPLYSAVKYQGRRLYDYARKGEGHKVPLSELSRKVVIHSTTVHGLRYATADEILPTTSAFPKGKRLPVVELRVECSKGTYIRGLCDTIGRILGAPATMVALKRMETAGIKASECILLEQLVAHPEQASSAMVSLEDMPLSLARVYVSDSVQKRLAMGQRIAAQVRLSDLHCGEMDLRDFQSCFEEMIQRPQQGILHKKDPVCLVLGGDGKVKCLGKLSVTCEYQTSESPSIRCLLRPLRELSC